MNLEKEYEKRFGAFPLSNITYYLIAGQVVAFLLMMSNPVMGSMLNLKRDLLFSGQWWRLFTFLFIPLSMSPLWAMLEWYFMYMIGMALEREWGAFQYMVYLLLGYAAAVLGALVFGITATNSFIFLSLFLAFAQLNPEFTILLFFILPVKIKWLAWATWFGLGVSVLFSGLGVKIQTVLSVLNFAIFFGKEIVAAFQDTVRHGSYTVKQKSLQRQIYMQCVVCHATQEDKKIFYYCHQCIPELCYCDEHLKKHTHKIIN